MFADGIKTLKDGIKRVITSEDFLTLSQCQNKTPFKHRTYKNDAHETAQVY